MHHSAPTHAYEQPSVLVVGPDANVRDVVRNMLVGDGYSNREAAVVIVCPYITDASGLLALAAVRQRVSGREGASMSSWSPANVAPLIQALYDVLGRSMWALSAGPVGGDALEREVAFASW